MGLIFSRSKKQKTTVEILEELDKNITKLQQFKRQNQEYQKKLIASLLLYSFFICLFAAIVIFLYYLPTTWKGWCFVFFPLILFIVLIWLVKKVLQWYYVKQISSNEQDLQELRNKKKAILEEVLENETYKVAKEIFEKFDPARFKKLEGDKTPEPKTAENQCLDEAENQCLDEGVRHRIVTTQVTPVIRMPPSQSHPMSALHSQPRFPPHTSASTSFQLNGSQRPVHSTYSPGPPMPRPVPPRDRTTFDKLVDYVVGEGPQNRYALICRYCHSHNGMAIKEEFEFISFRCCYCYYLNPAKKQRPQAPKLDILSPLPSSSNSPPQTSDSKLALTHEKQNLSSGPESDESPEENEGSNKKDAAASDAASDAVADADAAADDDEYDDMTGEGISENKSEDECTTNTTEDNITEKETSEKSDTKDGDNLS